MKTIFKILYYLFKENKKILFVSMIYFSSISFFSLLIIALQRDIIVKIQVFDIKNLLNIIFLIIIYIVFIHGPYSTYFRSYVFNKLYIKLELFYQGKFIDKLSESKHLNFYDNEYIKKIEICRRFSYNPTAFTLILISAIFEFFPLLIGIFLLVFEIHYLYFVYFLVFFVLKFFIETLNQKHLLKYEKDMANEHKMTQYLEDICFDYDYAKANRINNIGRYFADLYNSKSKKDRKDIFNISRKNRNRIFLIDFIKNIINYFVIFLIIYNVFKGHISIAEFVVLFSTYNLLDAKIQAIYINITSAESEFIGCIDFVNFISKDKTKGEKRNPITQSIELLQLENVTFSYPNSKEVIKNLNLKLDTSKTIAILGLNGSGKTTLSKILVGLFSINSGTYKINNLETNENNFPFEKFSTAFQEFVIYNTSVIDNIIFGKEYDEKVQDNLDNYLKIFKDSNIKEVLTKSIGKTFNVEGIELSGGEKQLLSIFRSLMHESEVIILDEPTSSLDVFKEQEIIENLSKLTQFKKTIIISHSISFSKIADIIILMENGEIVEVGSHSELINNNGYYRKMFEAKISLFNGRNNL